MVERWKQMAESQQAEYVERSMAAVAETDAEAGSHAGREGVCDERMTKKLKKYVRSRMTYRWEYSGFLWFVDELFGICGDMSVSPEENVRMFAAMWREVGEEEQGRYRRAALESWSKEKKARGRSIDERAAKRARPQRDSNPQPSAP